MISTTAAVVLFLMGVVITAIGTALLMSDTSAERDALTSLRAVTANKLQAAHWINEAAALEAAGVTHEQVAILGGMVNRGVLDAKALESFARNGLAPTVDAGRMLGDS